MRAAMASMRCTLAAMEPSRSSKVTVSSLVTKSSRGTARSASKKNLPSDRRARITLALPSAIMAALAGSPLEMVMK